MGIDEPRIANLLLDLLLRSRAEIKITNIVHFNSPRSVRSHKAIVSHGYSHASQLIGSNDVLLVWILNLELGVDGRAHMVSVHLPDGWLLRRQVIQVPESQ